MKTIHYWHEWSLFSAMCNDDIYEICTACHLLNYTMMQCRLKKRLMYVLETPMPVYVNTNVTSLKTLRNITNLQNQLNTTYQRLSSGLRINSAKDDAAGLQIANRLTAQITDLIKVTAMPLMVLLWLKQLNLAWMKWPPCCKKSVP